MLRTSHGRHALIARRGYVVLMILTSTAVCAVFLCLGQSESHIESFEYHALVSEHPQNNKLLVSGTSLQNNGPNFTDLKNSKQAAPTLSHKILLLLLPKAKAVSTLIGQAAKRIRKSLLPPAQRKRRQRRCRRRCRKKHPGNSAAARNARRVCRKKCGNGDSGQYDDEPDISPEENIDTETAEDEEDDQDAQSIDDDTDTHADDASGRAGGVEGVAHSTAPVVDDHPASPDDAHDSHTPEAPILSAPAVVVGPSVSPEVPAHESSIHEAPANLASSISSAPDIVSEAPSPAPEIVFEAPTPETPAPLALNPAPVVAEAPNNEALGPDAPSFPAPSPAPVHALESTAPQFLTDEAHSLPSSAPVVALGDPADDVVDNVASIALPVTPFKLQDFFNAYDADRERRLLFLFTHLKSSPLTISCCFYPSCSTCSYLSKAVKLTTAKSHYEVSREA
jgi:hypothetical protein